MTDLDELTVGGACELIGQGSLSSVELVEATLRRIEETEPLVHAYARVTGERALEAARRADAELAAGRRRGPLHGVPFAVKDVFCTHDAPTEAGSRILAGHIPPHDATAVRRLREAGAVLVGKLVTHEFACGQNMPPTRNAWNPSHRPGGSSAGAGVAVAVGSALATLGTDSGGSVRKPASLNGVVGLKPTLGRLSRHGVIPTGSTLDHVGIVTRTVEDCALVLQAVAGPDAADASSADEPVPDYSGELAARIAGARLGVASHFFGAELDAEVRAAVEEAMAELERLGARLVDVEISSLELSLPIGFTIFLGEAAAYHRRWLRERPQDYEPETRRALELGSLLPAVHVEQARRGRALIRAELAAAFRRERLDALVTPTLPRPSIGIDEMTAADLPRFLPYVFPPNLAGLQLIGAPFAEGTVLRIGHAYQQATVWHRRRPQLAAPGVERQSC